MSHCLTEIELILSDQCQELRWCHLPGQEILPSFAIILLKKPGGLVGAVRPRVEEEAEDPVDETKVLSAG